MLRRAIPHKQTEPSNVFCHYGCTSLPDGRPGQAVLDALASHNRHRARAAALIMWRTCLRVSKVLELEWRDVDYTGDTATLLVRRSKTRKARTVRLHPELVQLFTNWPANRSPRDRVVVPSN